MSWLDEECYLSPLQSLVVFLLLSYHIHFDLFLYWRCIITLQFFNTQVSSISTEELVLLCHTSSVLSHFCCNGHSLLLDSHLSKIGRIENFSCSACEHLFQDIFHLILHCPATESLCDSLFGGSLFLYNLWSRPWGVAWLLGQRGLLPCLHPFEGV